MNFSCNNTNIRKTSHLWVEICIITPNIDVILCGKGFLKRLGPHSPIMKVSLEEMNRNVPKFPNYRGYTV